MSHSPSQPPPEGGGAQMPAQDAHHSVIEFLESRTGEAPRLTLRDEESAQVGGPLIDPSSAEKLAVPKGRGNYQLMGEIARGGMGVVLKGHDTDLGRDIAVKVLHGELAQRVEVMQRFVEEAQIGGQLQHPGIVPVYELGLMEDERPYFTMKLVKGRTLAVLLGQRDSPNAERARLLDIFESVCQTMAYAHSRGVIHRDLKPANIMVGAFGEVQVVDWGLAKVLARGAQSKPRDSEEEQLSNMTVLETVRSDASSTGTESLLGSVLGTPAYMPPEQARGQVDRLDERADVFALGAILCEILTGKPPYVGERAKIISAAAMGELEDAFERLDACPAEATLVKLAKQCLMEAPAARPADASVVAERMRDHVNSVEERAHHAEVEAAEARVRAVAEGKARRLTLALGAAVVAVVLVGSFGWHFVQSERAAGELAENQRLQQAAARDLELSEGINAALNEAAVFEGAERWDEALVAAERARALAEGGGASGELLEVVASKLAGLNAELAAARAREELELETRRLLAELREVAQPDELLVDAEKEAQFQATFLAHGIDLDAGSLEVAAEQLTRRGLGSEVALLLDAWGEKRRLVSDSAGAERLLDLAHTVDPDPDRAHLREAMAARDLDELRYLASKNLSQQPANTWALLAASLVRLGDRALALSVYRSGVERHPDDLQLHYLFASELSPGPIQKGVEDEMLEGARHFQAVLALQPDNHYARHYLARLLGKLGHHERALEQLDLAIALAPEEPTYWFRKAQQLGDLDRNDEALALFERCAAQEGNHWSRGWGNSAVAANLAFAGTDLERALELSRTALSTNASLGQLVRVYMFRAYARIAAMTADEAVLREARAVFDLEYGLSAAGHEIYARGLIRATERLKLEEENPLAPLAGQRLVLTEALDVARAGLELESERPGLWNDYGVASYLLGNPQEALEAFQMEDELDGIDDAENWLSQALALHAVGDVQAARDGYLRAIRWVAANPDVNFVSLDWFRIEVERALGL